MESPEDWLTVADVVRAAKRTLTPPLWVESGSGPGAEVTVRRNRAAFDRLALMPQVLCGAAAPDLSTTFLGTRLSLPVMPAPVGGISRFCADGAIFSARAAAQVGTMSYVASSSTSRLEEVRAAADGPLVFQLYAWEGDRDWQESVVRRVENVGYTAFCATVDSAGQAVFDRLLTRDRVSAAAPGTVEPGPVGVGMAMKHTYSQARLTWDDIAWLRERTKLPFILKGVLSPRDAERAVQAGADVVHVSNHGGRRQDALPSTIEMLPQLLAVVARRARVVVDGGLIRGPDVVKALALGADAVCIGKLQIWALAAGGEAGLVRALELLGREIAATMANIGARTIADLTPEMVVPSFEPPAAPWPVEPMHLLL